MTYENLDFILDFVDSKTLVLGGKIGMEKINGYSKEVCEKLYNLIEEINPTKIFIIQPFYIDLYYKYKILNKKRKIFLVFTTKQSLALEYYDGFKIDYCLKYKCNLGKNPVIKLLELVDENPNLKIVSYSDLNNLTDKEHKLIRENVSLDIFSKFNKLYLSNKWYKIGIVPRKYKINDKLSNGNASSGMLLLQLLVNNNKIPYILGFSHETEIDPYAKNVCKDCSHDLVEECNAIKLWHDENKLISLDILANKQIGSGINYKIKYTL